MRITIRLEEDDGELVLETAIPIVKRHDYYCPFLTPIKCEDGSLTGLRILTFCEFDGEKYVSHTFEASDDIFLEKL